ASGGQFIDFSIHAACNLCTESWLARYMVAFVNREREPQYFEAPAADGRYMVAMTGLFGGEFERMVAMMAEEGMAEDLQDEKYQGFTFRQTDPEAKAHIEAVVRRYVASQHSEEVFHKAQRRGVVWAPIRPPHTGPDDAHFAERGTCMNVAHPELGRDLPYA